MVLTLTALALGLPLFGTLIDQPKMVAESVVQHGKRKLVIGYVQDEDGAPSFADQVDYSKVTHLNIAFANPTDSAGDFSVPPHIDDIVARAHKEKVKVLISIGGGMASEDGALRTNYYALITNPNRAGFVSKLVKYVDDHNLDGLDVDLEGPAINKDYEALVGDLAKALKPKGKLLTAAVSSGYGGDQITAAALSKFDIVNVMAYDGTGPWNPDRPGQHSSMDMAKDNTNYWIGRGVPKSKLVLGLPFYGYGFGEAFTKDGYTFSQIVDKFPGAELVDQIGKTIWYNGIPTIQAKTRYALEQDLAGVMIWSLNQDAKGKQSLLAAIHDAMQGAVAR
jgi:GH18 family chitinase